MSAQFHDRASWKFSSWLLAICCRALARSGFTLLAVDRRGTSGRLRLAPVLLVLPLVAASVARGGESDMEGPPGGYYHTGAQPYNVEQGFWQDHSSTAAEGFLRGASSVIQARGVADLHHSQAAILWEQAEWLNYQNYKERIETRYEAREMRRDYLTGLREDKEQKRTTGLEKLREREATIYRQTYALPRHQFNPVNGQLAWPSCFKYAEFREAREQVATLLLIRSRYQQWEDEKLTQELVRAIEGLQRALAENRDAFAYSDYNDAVKFVRGLKYEALFPTRA